MKYCPKCKETKPLTEFKEKANPRYESDVYFAYCNPCATAYKMKHRKDNLGEYRTYQNGKNREYLIRRRTEAIAAYGGKCKCCGESAYQFLCFDHVNNDGAEHRKEVAPTQLLHWLKKNNYPDTIQLLCYNCNMAKSIHGGCPPNHKNLRAEERQRITSLMEEELLRQSDKEREVYVKAHKYAVERGQEQERASLIEKVEGIEEFIPDFVPENAKDLYDLKLINGAWKHIIKSKILTHLRGDSKKDGEVRHISESGIQEETECCVICFAKLMGGCGAPFCPCHRQDVTFPQITPPGMAGNPRTEQILDKVDSQVGGALRALGGDKLRTEETEEIIARTDKQLEDNEKGLARLRGEETEKEYCAGCDYELGTAVEAPNHTCGKEGASFSGREVLDFLKKRAEAYEESEGIMREKGMDEIAEIDHVRATCLRGIIEKLESRPKENTTPQSREQGGEKEL